MSWVLQSFLGLALVGTQTQQVCLIQAHLMVVARPSQGNRDYGRLWNLDP